jgi:tetratricopeptide (TPR) repeat protein
MKDFGEDFPTGDQIVNGVSQAESDAYFSRLLAKWDYIDNEIAIRRLGHLIDLSEIRGRVDGIEIALVRGNDLLALDLEVGQQAVLHYFLSNAWEAKRRFFHAGSAIYDWEQPELEKEIVHLRSAVQLASQTEVEPARLCQMHTNLGNLLSHCGRIVDAVASWDQALEIDPNFAMAVGNRGFGLMHYAKLVHDPGHQVFHLREAHADLTRALAPDYEEQLDLEVRAGFAGALKRLIHAVPIEILTAPSHSHTFPKGMAHKERLYRTWCLTERLFLNDLNDLGTDPIAAADVLTLPSIVTPIKAPQPNAIGFFNQLKQEYVSARYLYYEGVTDDKVHFSDREVTLINTLDYPAYGLAVEKVKVAFRIAYSLLDKVAYFLNDYLGLGILEKRVSFRGLWYKGQDPRGGLRADVHRPDNAPLKGLFSLAKDLYEKTPGFSEAMEPDAREVAEIRNHLEHKYFKLHLFWPPRPPNGDSCPIGFELLAYSMERRDFERRTLRLLHTARSALIYVSQVVHVEESRRRSEDEESGRALPLQMNTWEDDHKF